MAGRGAGYSYPGSLSLERLDQMNFQSPFQPGLFYSSMTDFLFIFFKFESAGSLPPRSVTLNLSPMYLGWMLRAERVV